MLLAEKLFQDFTQAEFTHHLFVEQLPICRDYTFPVRQSDFHGFHAAEIKVRVNNLLCRDRRILEDEREILPTLMGFQELLGESGTSEIGEDQFVANVARGLC